MSSTFAILLLWSCDWMLLQTGIFLKNWPSSLIYTRLGTRKFHGKSRCSEWIWRRLWEWYLNSGFVSRTITTIGNMTEWREKLTQIHDACVTGLQVQSSDMPVSKQVAFREISQRYGSYRPVQKAGTYYWTYQLLRISRTIFKNSGWLLCHEWDMWLTVRLVQRLTNKPIN